MSRDDASPVNVFDRIAYASARPWPHLVIDGFFDEQLIAEAESEEISTALRLPEHRSFREQKAESPKVSGPAAQKILDQLTSTDFVQSLETMTGISGLQPDKEFFLGGLNVARRGGFQSLHRDFRTNPRNGLFHRLVVLVYLNSDWPDDFAGDLELWSPELAQCEKRIKPHAGRLVVFEVTPRTIHGVPDPVACPEDRARLTLVSRYYTKTPPHDEARWPVFRRPRRPGDPHRLAIAGPRDALSQVRPLAYVLMKIRVWRAARR